jgi:PBP1b-binding outer membrane lipoprotein LpoB
MKKQTIIGVIVVIAILAVLMFAGCVEKEASETAQTVEPMSTPSPTTSTPEPTLSIEKPTANFGNSGG